MPHTYQPGNYLTFLKNPSYTSVCMNEDFREAAGQTVLQVSCFYGFDVHLPQE